ncbi:hypothetical protein MSAR_04810 [Mycolicibacterium sarraceniae]|uniref:Uncharacterized protein n=1 Tax=Mycolicibacterium sarraceniae TaxID=1534348 RepID=A0A7I7SMV4_9MYCO|nr:hypothetical protein MSAR_04810 [Mycolicibacterium sarraceniae]
MCPVVGLVGPAGQQPAGLELVDAVGQRLDPDLQPDLARSRRIGPISCAPWYLSLMLFTAPLLARGLVRLTYKRASTEASSAPIAVADARPAARTSS